MAHEVMHFIFGYVYKIYIRKGIVTCVGPFMTVNFLDPFHVYFKPRYSIDNGFKTTTDINQIINSVRVLNIRLISLDSQETHKTL